MNYKFVWSVVVLRGIIAAQKITSFVISRLGPYLFFVVFTFSTVDNYLYNCN